MFQYFLSLRKQKKTNKFISEQNNQLVQMANELKMAKEVTEAANKELEAFCTQFHTIYEHNCGE